jgi:hypothetical protein
MPGATAAAGGDDEGAVERAVLAVVTVMVERTIVLFCRDRTPPPRLEGGYF